MLHARNNIDNAENLITDSSSNESEENCVPLHTWAPFLNFVLRNNAKFQISSFNEKMHKFTLVGQKFRKTH